MWQWLEQHATLLSALANMVFVVIWIVYLQIFYLQFHRQRQPCLVIHHAQGHDPTDLCMLVNMSSEAVHVQCVLARVQVDGQTVTRPVTYRGRVPPEQQPMENAVRQGPLQPAGYFVLGTIHEILDFSHRVRGDEIQQQHRSDSLAVNDSSFEVCVAAVHGPSEQMVGARRRFVIRTEGQRLTIRPEELHTEQYTSRNHKRTVERWLEEYMEAALE